MFDWSQVFGKNQRKTDGINRAKIKPIFSRYVRKLEKIGAVNPEINFPGQGWIALDFYLNKDERSSFSISTIMGGGTKTCFHLRLDKEKISKKEQVLEKLRSIVSKMSKKIRSNYVIYPRKTRTGNAIVPHVYYEVKGKKPEKVFPKMFSVIKKTKGRFW